MLSPSFSRPCVCSEEALEAMAAAVAPVREVRGVRDKFTGAPRGFCFLHLFSIADASRVMQLLQARASWTSTVPAGFSSLPGL